MSFGNTVLHFTIYFKVLKWVSLFSMTRLTIKARSSLSYFFNNSFSSFPSDSSILFSKILQHFDTYHLKGIFISSKFFSQISYYEIYKITLEKFLSNLGLIASLNSSTSLVSKNYFSIIIESFKTFYKVFKDFDVL